MSKKPYDLVVMIGRYSPFHIGHKQVIENAHELGNEVLILIGSSNRPRTIKNPWTFDERKEMIWCSLTLEQQKNTTIAPLDDHLYNDDAWIKQVQSKVETYVNWMNGTFTDGNVASVGASINNKIALIGHQKDESSFYLKLFPQWDQIDHSMNEIVHATDIRDLLFGQKNPLYLKSLLPDAVFEYIKQFTETTEFELLTEEYAYIQNYRNSWAAAPFPPTFVTADAVVTKSGHILMIERGFSPGKGLLALPGGFINQNEFIECAALRELKEETQIDISFNEVKNNIKASHVFDHPQRSLRGRIITHAYHIELPAGPLPFIQGADDAKRAMWVPYNEINSKYLFEDHYDIIKHFINV